MEDIVLIGGGGHCRSVIDVIELEAKYNIIGIVDKKELIGEDILGYKIIGCDDDLEKIYENCKKAVVTVGHIISNEIRVRLYETLKKIGFELPVIISPNAYVSKHASIGESTVVMHYSLVNANANIGKNCIINTKALIEHDCVVEDNSHISTAAIINGGVRIKEGSFIGSNSVTKEYIEVKGFQKAGSVVK